MLQYTHSNNAITHRKSFMKSVIIFLAAIFTIAFFLNNKPSTDVSTDGASNNMVVVVAKFEPRRGASLIVFNNNKEIAAKDFTIKCHGIAPSGTSIQQYEYTSYDVIASNSKVQVNINLVLQNPQVVKLECFVLGATYYDGRK